MKSVLNTEGQKSLSIDDSAEEICLDDIQDEKTEGLLVALSMLEDELDQTAIMLEADNIEQKRLEFQRCYPQDSTDDLQSKLDEWIQDIQDKHCRCSDAIGIIQDDLGKWRYF
jgi:predicted nuclease with TOPRIM domain